MNGYSVTIRDDRTSIILDRDEACSVTFTAETDRLDDVTTAQAVAIVRAISPTLDLWTSFRLQLGDLIDGAETGDLIAALIVRVIAFAEPIEVSIGNEAAAAEMLAELRWSIEAATSELEQHVAAAKSCGWSRKMIAEALAGEAPSAWQELETAAADDPSLDEHSPRRELYRVLRRLGARPRLVRFVVIAGDRYRPEAVITRHQGVETAETAARRQSHQSGGCCSVWKLDPRPTSRPEWVATFSGGLTLDRAAF